MRTKEELKSKEFNDDMSDLVTLLKKKKIRYVIKKHEEAENKVKELIGYYPTGEWHILIYIKSGTYSVIKGMVSFGDYEIMNIGGGKKFEEPERFKTAEELFNSIK